MLNEVSAEMLLAKLQVDWPFDDSNAKDRDPKVMELYENMEPFGQGNPEPLFAIKGQMDYPREVGVNHLKFGLRINGASFSGIGFNLADNLDLVIREEVELAFHLRRNSFKGKTSWQLNATSVRPVTI